VDGADTEERIVEGEKNSDINECKGRGVGDLREDGLEGFDAAVNTFTQFPELRTEC